MTSYEAPRVEELGSLAELTAKKNKVGPTADIYSSAVPIVGSITSI
jgi:hypothetical protein